MLALCVVQKMFHSLQPVAIGLACQVRTADLTTGLDGIKVTLRMTPEIFDLAEHPNAMFILRFAVSETEEAPQTMALQTMALHEKSAVVGRVSRVFL